MPFLLSAGRGRAADRARDRAPQALLCAAVADGDRRARAAHAAAPALRRAVRARAAQAAAIRMKRTRRAARGSRSRCRSATAAAQADGDRPVVAVAPARGGRPRDESGDAADLGAGAEAEQRVAVVRLRDGNAVIAAQRDGRSADAAVLVLRVDLPGGARVGTDGADVAGDLPAEAPQQLLALLLCRRSTPCCPRSSRKTA